MFNYKYLQMSTHGFNEVMNKLEKIKHIEFTNNSTIVTEQRSSSEISNENDGILEKMGSRALIKIDGMLMANPGWFERIVFGAVDTMEVLKAVEDVENDDEIETVVFAINSPGGSAEKIHIVANAAFRLSEKKPTASLNLGLMDSAAYFIGSQTRRIFVEDEMNLTGSIGTKAVVKDTSKMFKDIGVEVIPIVTGPLKAMLEPGTEITEEMKSEMQNFVNTLQENFDAAILRARPGVDLAEGSRARSGTDFLFKEASELGLVDGVKSLSETFEVLDQIKRRDNLRR